MRFAILVHDHPQLHWDLLLERGDVCWTWRLWTPPETPGPLTAERVADHRLLYLDYDGPVSGDRGTVRQWDAGSITWLKAHERCVECLCDGRRWQGRLLLEAKTEGWVAVLEPAAR